MMPKHVGKRLRRCSGSTRYRNTETLTGLRDMVPNDAEKTIFDVSVSKAWKASQPDLPAEPPHGWTSDRNLLTEPDPGYSSGVLSHQGRDWRRCCGGRRAWPDRAL